MNNKTFPYIVAISAFLVAFLLSIQYPTDDGTCTLQDTIDSCLLDKSIFDADENKCEWIKDSNGIYGCQWKEVERSMKVLALILILTILITAPCYGTLTYIFKNILLTPTTEKIIEDQENAKSLKNK